MKWVGRKTPPALRLYRLARLGLHTVEGVLTTTLVFPWIAPSKRHALIRRWSRRLLGAVNVELRLHGVLHQKARGNLLIVANHISWLDIFVIHSIQPSRFIAKSELRDWPLLGRLMSGVGTLFIERDSRRHTHDIKRRVGDALATGDVIAIFPEGTTSDGRQLLRFHSSLLQPIVEATGHAQPIAIRYLDGDGEHTDAAAYVGETTLMQSVWRLTAERRLIVQVHLLPPIAATERRRRELTSEAEAAIRTALSLPAGGSGPETRADRRA